MLPSENIKAFQVIEMRPTVSACDTITVSTILRISSLKSVEVCFTMANKPKDEKKDDEKRDEVLKKLLKTPPKPHKPKD